MSIAGNPEADNPAPMPFRWDYRVSYADCTVGDHIYYARYLDLLERARGEFFRHIGKPLIQLTSEDVTFPVVECHLEYATPARYDDLLTIEVGVAMAKGVRLNFDHRVVKANHVLVLQAQTLHACASVHGKPKRLPADLLARLQGWVQPPVL